MIDNEEVHIGDRVYVIGTGYGTVASVNRDGGFSVRIGSGEVFFRDGGFIGNQRRVYWHDPVFIHPSKSGTLWRVFKKSAATLYEQIQGFRDELLSIAREVKDEEVS